VKVKRIESTPEQIEEAILRDGRADGCRFVYALEVCPGLDKGEHKHWPLRVPVHAVIHALRKDMETYAGLLQEERQARKATEIEHQRLLDALGVVGQALGVLAVGS